MAIALPVPLLGQITPVALQLPTPTLGEITPVALRLPQPMLGESGPSTRNVVGSGGVGVGGAANIVDDPLSMKGGVQVTGAAAVSAITLLYAEIYPLGGTKVTGSAVVATNWSEYYPSGGVKLTGSASIVVAEKGSGGVGVGGAAFIGTLSAAVSATLPKLTTHITGSVPQVTASNYLDGLLPSLKASMSAVSTATASVSATLPSLQASLDATHVDLSATLPAVTAHVSAVIGTSINLSAELPKVTAHINAQAGVGGVVSAKLPRAKGHIVGLNGAIGYMSATLGSLACRVNAVTGITATISADLPELEASLVGAKVASATMSIKLPSIYAALTAEYVQEMLLTFVTNTLTTAGTTFSGFNFNSYAEIDGRYYSAGPDGLYEIEVPQVSVDYQMQTGYCSYKVAEQKRVSDFYMALHSEGDITLSVSVDEGDQYEYALSPEDISMLRQRRSALGKGLRGVFWQFGVSGDKDFDFDNYAVAFAPTARRI